MNIPDLDSFIVQGQSNFTVSNVSKKNRKNKDSSESEDEFIQKYNGTRSRPK